MIKNETVLIFGGAGSIGEELTRQLSFKNKLYIFDIDETRTYDLIEELKLKNRKVYGRLGDIKNKILVEQTIEECRPDIIIICSALKHVAPSMAVPREYIETNILGTLNILEAARQSKIKKLINISTDKVVSQDNIMGLTKKVTEMLTKIYGYTSVRFGNVMGSRGSVLEIWQRQIENNEPLTVTSEFMERYMMTIPEACKLVIQAAELGEGKDIFILDMGEKINILQLAKDILKKANKKENIKIIGIRPGEALEEKFMTEAEKKRAIKKGNLWRLK